MYLAVGVGQQAVSRQLTKEGIKNEPKLASDKEGQEAKGAGGLGEKPCRAPGPDDGRDRQPAASEELAIVRGLPRSLRLTPP